jgi:hypothetical protein
MAYNEHLRQHWIDKGYPGNMGSAAVVPPPPEGFRRLYHLTSAEYAISNIVFGRLKVARFSTLNDPFELLARSALSSQIRQVLQENKNKLNEEHGLLCFSENWIDPVLWTHYGAKHRGICLGFDVKSGFARKISYQSGRLSDVEARTKTDEEILDALLYTKFESWRYEQEWRVLLKLADLACESGLHFYEFDDRLKLTEVILGAECGMSNKAVRNLVSTHHPNANTIQARLAFGWFNIVPDEKTIISLPKGIRPKPRVDHDPGV